MQALPAPSVRILALYTVFAVEDTPELVDVQENPEHVSSVMFAPEASA
jgi:hypothetical protein